MTKRGQVTIFILLGILIVFIAIAIFFINQYTIQKSLEIQQEKELDLERKSQSVKVLVESCIRQVAERAVITVGYRAGKPELDDSYYDGKVFSANYLYYLGEGLALSTDEIESSLEKIMNLQLLECLPNDFKQQDIINEELVSLENLVFQGLSINSEEVTTVVDISNQYVIFTINWPLTLKLDYMQKVMENFAPVKLPVRLKKTGLFVEEFVQQLELNPYFIDAFYLLDQNLTIDMAIYEEDTYIFLITDENSLIDNEPFKFLFAAKIKIPEAYS